jgi:hypothetical protein
MRNEAAQHATLLASRINSATLARDHESEFPALLMRAKNEVDQPAMRLGLTHAMQIDPAIDLRLPARDIAAGTPVEGGKRGKRAWDALGSRFRGRRRKRLRRLNRDNGLRRGFRDSLPRHGASLFGHMMPDLRLVGCETTPATAHVIPRVAERR